MYTKTAISLFASALISACAASPGSPPQAPLTVDQAQYDYDWNDCMSIARDMSEGEKDDYMRSNRPRREEEDGGDSDGFGDELYDRDYDQLEGSIADDSIAMMHFKQCMLERGYEIRN